LPFSLVYFLWLTAVNVYPAAWSFFAPAQFGWDSKMVGISLTLVGVSMVAFQSMVIGRFVKRFGEYKTAIFGMLSGISGALVYALLTNGTIALFFTLFNGFAGMAMPSINAMMSQRTPPGQQGELQGLNGSLSALALLIAQLCYNNVLAFSTREGSPIQFAGAPFVLSAGAGLTALLALLFVARRKPDHG
jgi:MFS transporter, DHA1 family, tetracycline resistance protein